MPTKKQAFALPFRICAIAAFILVVLGAATAGIWKFLTGSAYFKVKEIIVQGADSRVFDSLKGRNIFTLDLDSLQSLILSACPDCSTVSAVKVFPDRVFIVLGRRNPVALVKLNTFFALDAGGYLFRAPRKEDLNLPVILGLQGKITSVRLGRRYRVRELALALQILQEVRSSEILRNYPVTAINVGDLGNASVIISTEGRILELKLGPDNIKDKFSILEHLLAQTKVDIASIKYIDMRFKDPVMKLSESDKQERGNHGTIR